MAPRISGGATRAVQLLLRITDEESDVLDAAAHLERQTANSYAYALLQAHINTLRTDPFVLRMLETRRQYDEGSADVRRLSASTHARSLAVPERGDRPEEADAPLTR